MEHSRLFLACDLDDEVITRLETVVGQLAPLLPNVRWVKRDAMHMTLKFFGEQPWDRVREIDRAMHAAGVEQLPCYFRVEGIGMFPHQNRPRVIWAGTGEGSGTVVDLADAVETACVTEGFQEDRRAFVPHVTLGRFRGRSRLSSAVQNEIEERFGSVYYGNVAPDEIVLYGSELTPQGPEYTRMASWPLG